MFSLVATFIVFISTLVFFLNWQKHSYWKQRGVPTPFSLPIIGHLHKLLSGTRWEIIDKIYKEFKSTGYWGMYAGFTPSIWFVDLAHIRDILVKEADHFIDRRTVNFPQDDGLFSEMLTTMKGTKWKALRSLMSPTFTSGKIKAMFPLIAGKCDDLINECNEEMNKNTFVQMKDLFGYFTMDVIATCAFGIDAHCFQNKEASQFIKSGSSFTIINFTTLIKFLLLGVSPKLFTFLALRMPMKTKFFRGVVEETVALRKKSGVKRGDFLDLTLEALEECRKKESDFKYPMTMNTIISQSILFILAGFDPTANTLCFVTYFLAKNPGAQKRLRKELQKLQENDGQLNYQNIMEAQYLDACLSETLRLYSPAFFIERCCTKRYKVPGSDFEIPEGMIVSIPTWSLHRDPEYWEDPLSFYPDRFLPENKGNIEPYTYFPFGLGPRNCIGMRFAQLEVKLAIAKLCLNFEMELRPGFEELTLEKTLSSLRPNKDGVQLVMKKIDPPPYIQ